MDLLECQTWRNSEDGSLAQYSSDNYPMLNVPYSNADGSKTPRGSLVNHPDCSSTMTDLLDGFCNQEVPYMSEEMEWSEFELVESFSTSPTSVRTPEEDFAPSVRSFYQHGGISPQPRQGQAGVMDVSVQEMEYLNNCFSQGQINKLIFGSQC